MANKNLFKAPFLRGELRMPDSNLGDLGIEWRWPRWWWPVAVWKYDSAIKRGRMARYACVREGKRRVGGDSARLLRPIKAQFKASYFFFFFLYRHCACRIQMLGVVGFRCVCMEI